MAWIRPDVTDKFSELSRKGISILDFALNRDLGAKEKTANINLNFDVVYNNSVYTTWESIEGLKKFLLHRKLTIDAILFTGHAGNGHRAPTRAIVKKFIEKSDKNVIIIDILSLFSKNIANFNDKAWVRLSQTSRGQDIWNDFIRGEIDIENSGFDIAPLFRVLYTKRLKSFIQSIQPKIVLSTYPYSNAILSKIADDNSSIEFAGVVVTDTEMLGFAMSAYGDVSKLHYFVASEETWNNGLRIYPYLKDSMGPIYIGTNPCFFDGEADCSNAIKDTVLFVPGSAEGLGMGIYALPIIARYCKLTSKQLICVSGIGKAYHYAKKIQKKYKTTLSLFSYVASEDLKNLITACEVVIAKAGGNMSSELVSKSGSKIFYQSIKGQETDNAEYYANLGVATNVGNSKKALIDALIQQPYTPSIYAKGIIVKSAVDTVVDTILPYFDTI
ncbi:MAG: hypothetical protein PHP54_03805 [Clostridia bacterium]|nr:hypothetical protein [Clostridia bacterium]